MPETTEIDHILSLALHRGAQQAEVFALETAETPVRFGVDGLQWLEEGTDW